MTDLNQADNDSPPEHSSIPRAVREFCFAMIVLLSPIAVFLCGFCCCLGVMEIEEGAGEYGMIPGTFAVLSFLLGLIGGVVLAVIALRRFWKALGLGRSNSSEGNPTDD